MNMNQKVKAGYNVAAKNYSFEFRDQFKNEKYLSELVAVLQPNSTILDVGCGAGEPIDSFLVSKGMAITGIDISEAQIQLAQSNVPEADYEVKDMSELSDGEYQVDAVVSFYAIFHTPREKHLDLLKKLRSFLKPSGYLLITMGASDWEGKEDNFCGAKMYWSHYGEAKNIDLVSEAGFEVTKSEIDRSGGEKHLVILAKAK
jgi:cyclopropane fatty-acyl-phospholipid synthase-like methyltransferase